MRVNEVDEKGQTSLFAAVETGKLKTVKCLLDHDAKVTVKDNDGCFPIHFYKGNKDILELLVERGADIHVKDKDGNTIRHFGKIDIVRFLVEHGATAEEKNRALTEGINNLDIVKYLAEHGTDLNYQDKDGYSPLHLAVKNGNLDIVKYLVIHDAKIDLKSKLGETPLDLAKGEIATYLKSR